MRLTFTMRVLLIAAACFVVTVVLALLDAPGWTTIAVLAVAAVTAALMAQRERDHQRH